VTQQIRNPKILPSKIALLVFLGVVLAVYVRIHFDMDSFGEYDSHNLLPIEFIAFAIYTIPSAFAGAYLGLLIKKFKKIISAKKH